MENPKKKSGRTSNESKYKYEEKAYDRVSVVFPKGRKAEIQTHAEAHSESLNAFMNRAAEETIQRDKEREAGRE